MKGQSSPKGLRPAALNLGATATWETNFLKAQQGAVSPRCKSFKVVGSSLDLGTGTSTQSCSFCQSRQLRGTCERLQGWSQPAASWGGWRMQGRSCANISPSVPTCNISRTHTRPPSKIRLALEPQSISPQLLFTKIIFSLLSTTAVLS